ncbi:hypothetical protein BUALT_Bualt01G0022100 [Buddleja alternifolia]|uniref:Uncharacterized protein n=1 Tax=Buddleja alternifolia TaxID=168488 RepID=A0AAV6YAT5_9LAMI|nr:hypothetical protein BUALT_Bualt01G0022100 [Buddleja alternifolia]
MDEKFPYPPCENTACTTRKCCARFMYKTIWPNLLGMAAEEAKAIIVQDNPLVTVVSVPPGVGVIHNFCCNRVWLWLDEKNHVQLVPKVG